MLMVIGDFDFLGMACLPPETDAVLIVDAYAVLPATTGTKRLTPVARGNGKIAEIADSVQLVQLPAGN